MGKLSGIPCFVLGCCLAWVVDRPGSATARPPYTVVARVTLATPAWIEAEVAREAAGERGRWQVADDLRASGGRTVLAKPRLSSREGAVANDLAGQLRYEVEFAEPGDYRILLRAKATGQLAESGTLRISFDGRELTRTDGLGGAELSYRWLSSEHLAVTVRSPGIYRIGVWAERPGYSLDAIYVTAHRSARPGEGQAIRADTFWHSVGVNTHLGWIGSAYDDLPRVEAALAYLGVRHIRDVINAPWEMERFDRLGALGYRFCLFVGFYEDRDLAWKMRQIAARATMLDMVEGPNETDIWPVRHAGLTGLAATRAMMRDIHAAVRANRALKAVPVAQTSVAEFGVFDQLGDLGAYADRANIHSYFPWGDPPSWYISQRIREAQVTTPGKVPVATETGYYTALGGWGEVPEEVQAKYMPRVLVEQFSRGVERAYIYELLEPWFERTDTGHSFGLFHPDGTPKPAATAVRNLLSLVRDTPDKGFVPGKLSYTLYGMPETADDLLLQRGDGTFLIILWNDVKIWDSTRAVAVPAAQAQVSIELGHAVGQVILHDTLSGLASELPDSGRIQVSLPDRAIVVELRPARQRRR